MTAELIELVRKELHEAGTIEYPTEAEAQRFLAALDAAGFVVVLKDADPFAGAR